MTPQVSIITVSYNCKELMLATLKSLYANAKGVDFEMIVVDNDSRDGTVEAIATDFPAVKLIALTENVGFGRGCNAGAKHASGEYILLLNPDTVVLPTTLSSLLAFASRYPKAGIWGGKTYFEDGSLDARSVWRFPTLWSTFCWVSGLSRAFPQSELFNGEAYGSWNRDSIKQVDVIAGCLFLIRTALWRKIDGFDPIYFLYSEEIDLCLRAARAGASPLFSPDVGVVHLGSKTMGVKSAMLIRLLRGKVTYMARNWSPIAARLGAWLLVLWPLSRYVALALAGGASARESAASWREVWQRRREWLAGYQPPTSWPEKAAILFRHTS